MSLGARYEEFHRDLLEADNERFLFHYTRGDTALEHILPRRELRLSPFADTNDPREAKAWNFAMIGEEGQMDRYEALTAEANDMLKETCKVLCLSMDNPAATGSVPIWARGYAHSSMWAHYADGHRGVCLVFDRKKLIDDVVDQLDAEGDAFRDAVIYRNDHDPKAFIFDSGEIEAKGLVGAVITHMWRHYKTLFFQKSTDWASEFEYRFVLRKTGDSGPFFVSVSGALVGVILGDSVSEAYQPSVDRACEVAGIGASRIFWVNGEPRLRLLAPA